MKKIRELLEEGVRLLKHSQSAVLDSQLLLMQVLHRDKLYLLMNRDENVTEQEEQEYRALLEKRAECCPIAYLLGEKPFYGRDFCVKQGILIPRPDTEILVEQVLARIKEDDHGIEIGVGSGAICVTLLCEKKSLKMTAVDVEEIPIEVTKKNALRYEVQNRITLLQTSLFNGLEGQFDFIVSNPPYITSEEILHLQKDVLLYEPKVALEGGEDGLKFYREIVKQGKNHLKEDGFFAFEIGAAQGMAVQEICKEEGFGNIVLYQDLSGLDRVVVAGK